MVRVCKNKPSSSHAGFGWGSPNGQGILMQLSSSMNAAADIVPELALTQFFFNLFSSSWGRIIWSQSVPIFLTILESFSLIANQFFFLLPLKSVVICLIIREWWMRRSKIVANFRDIALSSATGISPTGYSVTWVCEPQLFFLGKDISACLLLQEGCQLV